MTDIINVFIGGSLPGLEQIMAKLDEIKQDLADTKAALDEIKAAVTSHLDALKQQVDVLQGTIATLQAGDALEQEQITALVDQAEAVKVAADDTLASIKPAS